MNGAQFVEHYRFWDGDKSLRRKRRKAATELREQVLEDTDTLLAEIDDLVNGR